MRCSLWVSALFLALAGAVQAQPPEPAFRGQVTDTQGRPLAGIEIWRAMGFPEILSWEETGDRGDPVAVTGADGSFAARGAQVSRDGLFLLCSPGYLTERIRYDQLPAEPLHIVLRPASRISVLVTDGKADPIEGAQVSATLSGLDRSYVDNTYAPCPGDGDFRNGVTDEQGRFTLEGLEAGWFEVRVQAKDFLPAMDRFRVTAGESLDAGEIILARAPVVATPRREVRGRVLGLAGEPVAGASVRFEGGKQTTDDGGSFTILVPARRNEVRVEKEGYLTARLDLKTGGKPLEVEVRLEEGGVIEGRVTGLGKLPVHEVLIQAENQEAGLRLEARPDAEGRYRLGPLAPGWWHLIASLGSRTTSGGILVDREHRASMDLWFQPSTSVRGRVLDPEGNPAPKARVTFVRSGREPFTTWTTSDGTCWPPLEEGVYEVSAWLEGRGMAWKEQPLVVAGDETQELELRIIPGAVLTGRILGLDRGVIANTVRAVGPRPDLARSGKADQDGGYQISDLPPGTWTIVVSARGKEASVRLEIAPGATAATLDVVFPR